MVKQFLLTLSKENPVLQCALLSLLLLISFNTNTLRAQQMVCNDQVNVSLDLSCRATIGPDMILEGPSSQYGGPFTIFIGAPNVLNNNTSAPTILHPGFYRVTITNSFNNNCWGNILVEDKLPPQVECACPVGNQDPACDFLCTDETAFHAGTLQNVPKPIVTENCGNVTELYSDQIITVGLDCGEKIIRRTYVYTDIYGNVSLPCVSEYRFNAVDINVDVDAPYNNIQMNCGSDYSMAGIYTFFFNKLRAQYKEEFLAPPYNYSNAIAEAEATEKAKTEATKHAWPTVNGLPLSTPVCNIVAAKSDTEILACGLSCSNSKKVIRLWTLIDWCTGESITITQIIKATDDEAPTIVVPNITVSVDPWICAGNFLLPAPTILHDNCDDNPTYTVSGPIGAVITFDIPSKRYLVIGAPKGVHTFTYFAKDCCNNIRALEVTVSVLDYTAPVPVAKQNIIISLTTGGEGDGIAKLFANSVDNGSYDGCTGVKLEIRREKMSNRDTEGCGYTGNFTYNADGHPFDGSPNPISSLYDTDNGAYVKFCCDDLTDREGNVAFGIVKVWMRVWDDGNMSGVYGDILNGQPDNYNETWVNVRVEDKLTPKIVCPANVTITCEDDLFDLNKLGSATAFSNCLTLETEYTDRAFLNSCKIGHILRTWRIKGNPSITCVQRIDIRPTNNQFSGAIIWPADRTTDCKDNGSNNTTPTWSGGACDQIGVSLQSDTFYFEAGSCIKILNKWTVIDWCTYDPNASFPIGIYTRTQVIKVIDNEKPTLGSCSDLMFEIDDHADVDNDGNRCERKNLVLTMTATDQGQCASDWLKWTIFVDLWGDGTNDYEWSSFLPSSDVTFNDTNGNGIPDRYIAPTGQGGEVRITIPEDIVGSMSNHKVSWRVTDGCGNSTNCTQNFMVVDKKKPTPYCLNISSALMKDGTVELWAVDFNVGSFDNCTSKENLLFTFNEEHPVLTRLNQEHFFKGAGLNATLAEYNAGNAQKWLPSSKSSGMVFNCDDYPITTVKMTVWDQKLNYDFCVVTLNLADNQGACGGDRPRADITGSIQTQTGNKLSGATVILTNDIPEMTRTSLTSTGGNYEFLNAFMHYDYNIEGSKNDDYMNGVSTLDLVLIQRHILGISLLDNAYSVIAADINKDDKINTADIVELRKLILGIYNELPNNGSWRFVDGKQTFNNVLNPWPVKENIQIFDFDQKKENQNFVSVKVGDVNNSAIANAQENVAETRSIAYLNTSNAAVKQGEIHTLSLTLDNVDGVYGFQFTLNLNSAELMDIYVGNQKLDNQNIAKLSENTYTVSWNNMQAFDQSELIKLEIKINKSGFLAEMVEINSGVTSAEIYTGDAFSVSKLSLKFAGEKNVEEFQLYQNEPNPFQDKTNIQFNLPEAGDATLTIYDVTGKVVYSSTQNFGKGLNAFQVSRGDLMTSGVMIYTLESGAFIASKKMIGLE